MNYEFVVIGAGITGLTIARKIAENLNKPVLILEKHSHIGGLCHDSYDEHGVLIQNYGPHIFHASSKKVVDFLSQFTHWYDYEHTVLANVKNKLIHLPFNINTVYEVFDEPKAKAIERKLVETFGENKKIPILELMQTDDETLHELADFIYKFIFLNYTVKQWGKKPDELDAAVTSRVPVFTGRDNRYFHDSYQIMPQNGFSEMFKNMADHPNITVKLSSDFHKVAQFDNLGNIKLLGKEFSGKLIYTGCIDEFFNYCQGHLEYRTLKLKFRNLKRKFFQQNSVVNYPNSQKYTRITEFKHLTKQACPTTTIVREIPDEYNRNIPGKDIPYYPVQSERNLEMFQNYSNLAKKMFGNIIFAGRLGEFKYYNMDKAIENAIEIFEEKIEKTS